jgi:hypothetical protein
MEAWTIIGTVRRVLKELAMSRCVHVLVIVSLPFCLRRNENERPKIEVTHPPFTSTCKDEAEASMPYDAVVICLCPAHLDTAFRILTRENPSLSLGPAVLVVAQSAC